VPDELLPMDNPLPRPGEPPGPLGPVAVPEAGKLPAKRFRVALTFSGDKRDFIAQIASILANHFSEAEILYDKYHEAEFARRDLGFYLPALYHDQADLIVVVVCRDYEQKEWCGLEWDAIFDLLKKRKNDDVMLCRFDNATVKGLYSTAGFVDLDGKTPELTATRILERLALNEGKPKNYYHLKRRDRSSLAASPPPLPRPTQGPSPPPGEPSWPKSWKPTFAVSVIGAAAVVGILLYTASGHHRPEPARPTEPPVETPDKGKVVASGQDVIVINDTFAPMPCRVDDQLVTLDKGKSLQMRSSQRFAWESPYDGGWLHTNHLDPGSTILRAVLVPGPGGGTPKTFPDPWPNAGAYKGL